MDKKGPTRITSLKAEISYKRRKCSHEETERCFSTSTGYSFLGCHDELLHFSINQDTPGSRSLKEEGDKTMMSSLLFQICFYSPILYEVRRNGIECFFRGNARCTELYITHFIKCTNWLAIVQVMRGLKYLHRRIPPLLTALGLSDVGTSVRLTVPCFSAYAW